MVIAFHIMMFILGCVFGSFLCCEARRLHLPSSRRKSLGNRSVCLSCGHKLSWYENIPVFSWILLKGKCKNCGKKIGTLELFSELGIGLSFLAVSFTLDSSSLFNSISVISFILTLLLVSSFGFLAIYDGAYGELPNFAITISLVLAGILVALKYWSAFSVSEFSELTVLDTLLSCLVLGGTYLVLYLCSKGKWVGDGDWLLGLIIGLVLSSPFLSLLVLFLTNFLACLYALPTLSRNKKRKVYLAPFFFAAFIIVLTFSSPLTLLMRSII
ncbi:MAG: prepilin peptidase [Candidatus Saccharibacteria bacterium]|nr:prepilin peptidase [Candidatus Saccharibacteria bacterium]